MTRRATALLIALTCACVGATPAAAQEVTSVGISVLGSGQVPTGETAVNASFSGSLVIAFHGDPAGGCAVRGLCAYSGVLVWRPTTFQGSPPATLLVSTFRRKRRTSHQAELDFFGGGPGQSTGSVVVRRDNPGRSPGTCGDSLGGDGFVPLQVQGGRVSIELVGGVSTVFGSHCAGPLDSDLAGAMPTASLPLRAALAGHRNVALGGTRDFAAGGFAGTVHSTLTLHLGHAETSLTTQPPPPGARRQQFRSVTVPLTLAGLTGTTSLAVSGEANADVCSVLDSCGLHGTIAVTPKPGSGTGTLTVTGPARRPYRDFLAALGLSSRGRATGLEEFGSLNVGAGGTLSTSIVQGSICHEVFRLHSAEIVMIPTGRGLNAQYAPLALLKGRCPGPMVDSASGELASGVVPRRVSANGRMTIMLRAGGGFSDDGFSARLTGSLTVTLKLGRPRQRLVTTFGG